VKLGGTCPAKGIKCVFCEKVGHFKVKCRAYKQSLKKEKSASKEKKSQEANMIMSDPPPGNGEEHYLLGISMGDNIKETVMEWTNGDLSLIKGVWTPRTSLGCLLR
jgi:hypothetical protein